MTALSDLRSRVLAGSGEDRELERDLYWCLQRQWAERAFWNAAMGMPRPLGDKLPEGLGRLGVEVSAPRFLTDLNAVLALARERLPDLRPMVFLLRIEPQEWAAHFIDAGDTQYASSPARALLAALLEAMETSDDNA